MRDLYSNRHERTAPRAQLGALPLRNVPTALFILCALLAFPSAAGADPAVGGVAKTVETPPPFPVASGISHSIQKWSGLNWLTNRALSLGTSAALSAKTRGLVRANVQTYSFTDLFSGKFKSVELTSHNAHVMGAPTGFVHVKNVQPFQIRYFKHGSDRPGMKTAVMMNIDGAIAENELSSALRSHKVENGLRFLKLDLPGLGEQHLQILHPKVDLQGDKVVVDTFMITAGAAKDTGMPLKIIATPKLEKERFIMLRDMNIESTDLNSPTLFAQFAEELLNPLVDFGHMDRQTHAFRLTKLDIANDRVTYSGHLVLAPKPKQ